ncbi:MAG: hypothetical protein GY906_26815 [bacterium]|nr:hypothetical protein [bacterium]
MKLESIELRNTGPFTDAVRVGPFTDDLNVLAARNEAGKSTLLMGAARALFDRHNVTGEAIKRLQPAGTSLAPDITVVFLTPEGRFKIRKCFLNSATSELSEDRNGQWHPIADGDAADNRVLELIGGVRPGRGVSKAEHWGLLRYLWARQGEASDWPTWDDEAGAGIRSGLARVEIDPLVERLRSQLWQAQMEQLTSTGRVAKNSPLQDAQQAVDNLQSELESVRADMDQIDRNVQELQQLYEELVTSDREKNQAQEQAETLTETLKQLELLQKDLERFQSAFEAAQQRMNEIHKDSEALSKAETSLADAAKELELRRGEESRTHQDETAVREALSTLRDQAKTLQKKLKAGRNTEARLREIQELYDLDENLAVLRKLLNAVRKQGESIDKLRRKRAAVPNVSKAQVAELETSEQALRELSVRAEAVGLRVSITPERDVTISADRDGDENTRVLATGKATTVTATRNLRLQLPDWGELDITSGAEEAAEFERQIASSRKAADEELKKLGVASLDQARACAEQIKDLERDIDSAESRQAELLEDWDSLEALVTAVDAAQADAEKRRVRLNANEEETALSRAELKSEVAKTHADVRADETAWGSLQESIEAQGSHIEALAVTREEASRKANDTANRIASLESQLKTTEERYPDGIQQAEERAQMAFVESKAELNVAQQKLPEDWEKLEFRQDRALKSAAQANQEHLELGQRIQRLEGLLEHAGSQGLYSRESALVEAIASAKENAERLLNQALAARFLAGLIDYRKKAAVRTVLTPLEDQLSATFAEITGVRDRRVFLDENLQVTGVGRKRDESYAFTQLSQGAREQLLLALRAAVALELAKNGPQILILDDVLVNTDSTRQENVLDFVQGLAQQVQVLIVTCHAERYRGLGARQEIKGIEESLNH